MLLITYILAEESFKLKQEELDRLRAKFPALLPAKTSASPIAVPHHGVPPVAPKTPSLTPLAPSNSSPTRVAPLQITSTPTPIRKVIVIGGGSMGSLYAAKLALGMTSP